MADYTHLNLKQVEDQAPKFGMTDIEFRSARVPLEMENAGMSSRRLAPHCRMAFGRHHSQQEEVYVLVKGSARMPLNDAIIDLKPCDAVRIHKVVMRPASNGFRSMISSFSFSRALP